MAFIFLNLEKEYCDLSDLMQCFSIVFQFSETGPVLTGPVLTGPVLSFS